ncbi:MAG: hypothetical protein JO056_06065 [Alphaproteobacteria bacterium]|uniref:DUF6471 domain-containing protein n=1 Tax=Bradyrhizobium sp. TaxID=376 RepID=UPI001ECDAF07|nr:DUF6471 domain-containing protein [Bradyrhizobium sp.]MBV9570787.1 hypothetical protein [Alphaproteobacteria bacterium]MBV9979038.1 hypothetical protein [Bradyrhizobium sp.]
MPKTHDIDPEVLEYSRNSVRAVLRWYMTVRDVSVRELTRRLNEVGVQETEKNLRNKIARGEMQASLFLLCLRVLEAHRINLEELIFFPNDISNPRKSWL